MIQISNLAHKIESFLLMKGEDKFKIFIRINLKIEVYIISSNYEEAKNYQQEFLSSLTSTGNEQQALDDNNCFYQVHKDSLKINFIVVDYNDAKDDPFYNNMFSKDDVHIDWGPRYRFDSLLQSKKEIISKKRKTPIVTFYSYKGGMGRTTTMIAYAMSLAADVDVTKRKRVVIVDCDLEAPGYLNFFDLSEHNGLRSGKKNGLVEFICDAQLTDQPDKLDINDYIINVGLDNKNSFAYNNLDNIWLVPAGNLNEGYTDLESGWDRNDYLEGLAKINLSSVQSVVEYFNLLFDKIKETLNPDIILIDSRTGFNDIFGTAALYLSSCVIGFFGFSRQTQPGLINLLKEYYKETNTFKLQLVFSILPENSQEDWINKHKQEITGYADYIGVESKDYPSFLYLHRNPLLEKIGTGDEQSDSNFSKLVQSRKFEDYNILFDSINDLFFKQKNAIYTSNTPAIQLRNVVLKHLKNSLSNVSNFAEDTQIDGTQFFYRECMKELYNPQKFIIQGYKGTGKTYLYRALTDKEISTQLQQLSNNNLIEQESIYLNVLPTQGDKYAVPFGYIEYSKIQEPEFYFNFFWQLYTWNSILLLPIFSDIREKSELNQYVKSMSDGLDLYIRFQELINTGVGVLVKVKRDINQVNEFLKNNNLRLYLLYDRLDTCVNPTRWNKAVSPLINYWRDNCESYSNIVPKIFVRTDLFNQIEGTNTDRLSNNIVDIEWSIGEVFGYFFKLIFSNEESTKAYWAIAEKVGIASDYIQNTKKSFEKAPYNQFETLDLASMSPVIQVFFGKSVNVGEARLGSPWDYFSKELKNANGGISLRPFINTLDSNAVDKALARTQKYIREIISPEIYASKSVREETTNRYFDDLTRDDFSKDLRHLREVIQSSEGEKFRYKSLNETLFNELLNLVYGKIQDSEVVSSTKDLMDMITANGIMAKVPTTSGTYYRFAPIYWYTWGLVNSELENEDRRRNKNSNKHHPIYEEGKEYKGTIVEVKNLYGKKLKRVKCPDFPSPLVVRDNSANAFYEDEEVSFTLGKEADKNYPSKTFWFAHNVKQIED